MAEGQAQETARTAAQEPEPGHWMMLAAKQAREAVLAARAQRRRDALLAAERERQQGSRPAESSERTAWLEE